MCKVRSNPTSFARLSALLLSILLVTSGALAHASTPPASEALRLSIHWNQVLARRIQTITDHRVDALKKCPSAGDQEIAITHQIELLETQGGTSSAQALALMKAYQLTESLLSSRQSPCFYDLAAADRKLSLAARQKFLSVHLLPSSVDAAEYLKELDPWCVTDPAPDFEGTRDGNPCFAGEMPILRTFLELSRLNEDPYEGMGRKIDQVLEKFSEAVTKTKTGGTVDLSLLSPADLNHSISGRHQTLAIWAYLYAAGTFRLGWLDGFADRFWSEPLRNGKSPQEAYSQVVQWMNRKQVFAGYRDLARKNGLKIRFGEMDATDWNHHEFISAFLACDLQVYGNPHLAEWIPVALGVGYEAKDFVSHLKEGIGLKASIDNFTTDTHRHALGMELGVRECRIK